MVREDDYDISWHCQIKIRRFFDFPHRGEAALGLLQFIAAFPMIGGWEAWRSLGDFRRCAGSGGTPAETQGRGGAEKKQKSGVIIQVFPPGNRKKDTNSTDLHEFRMNIIKFYKKIRVNW